MRTISFLLILFSAFSLAENNNGVLNTLNNTKEKDFNLKTYFDLGIGAILKPKNKNHNYFLKAMNDKNYSLAFDLWLKHIDGSSFSRTDSGKSLYGFLLFKNNFFITGLSQLFHKSNPKNIHSSVHNLWNQEINLKHPAWDRFVYEGSSKWNKINNKDVLFKIGSKSSYKTRERIKYLLSLSTKEKFNKFPLEWSLVLTLIKEGNMKVATQILNWLIKESKPHYHSKIYLTIARLLNDIGEQKAALFYYQKVGKQIPYWIFAKEEEAWIHYNRGNHGKAFASASSLLYPEFRKRLSPRGFFTVALTQLKSCDYQGVHQSLNYFKNQFSDKYKVLKKVASKPASVMEDLRAYHVSKEKIRNSHWPSFIEKNTLIKDQLLLLDFIKKNDAISERSTSSIKRDISKSIRKIELFVGNRIRKAARKEIYQIDQILDWMDLIEVDSLYRIYGFHNLDTRSIFKKENIKSGLESKNLVLFPFERNEIWLDELNRYRTLSNKNCPSKSYVF